MEVVVLGCGPSSSVPSIRCLLTNPSCHVCHEAHANPQSRNRRLNPSVLVRNLTTGENLLVDCGKTFRESALRVFPAIGITSVHGVLLTHGHADACLGLDDLREVQAFDERIDPRTHERQKRASSALLLHCSRATREEIRGKFEYMIDSEARAPRTAPAADAAPAPFRWVAKARFELFEPLDTFRACGLTVQTFPVVHGAGYLSSAFEFGLELGVRFVYISDVSELTDDARRVLLDPAKPRIDVLLIDALYIDKFHSTHMNVMDVLREIRVLRPKRTLLTGMSHDLDYAKDNATLAALANDDGLDIAMAYDGLRIAFPLETAQ